MGIIDFILNAAGLLLWLSWRSFRFDPLSRTAPATLVGTLKPAHPRGVKGWQFIVGLVVLLFARALLYWALGSPVKWTPKLHMNVVVLAFRNDLFHSVLLYSVLGFAQALLIFYFWLLVLGALTRSSVEPDPVTRLVRLHVGVVARWPWPVLLLLPGVVVAGLWTALHPLLVWAGVLPRVGSLLVLLEQSLLLTGALVLTLKFVLPLFLLLYLVASYVYLGSNP
ncbi:MAG: hypothetical protein EHM39_13440, partial [Chloroflexi bacterium]